MVTPFLCVSIANCNENEKVLIIVGAFLLQALQGNVELFMSFDCTYDGTRLDVIAFYMLSSDNLDAKGVMFLSFSYFCSIATLMEKGNVLS